MPAHVAHQVATHAAGHALDHTHDDHHGLSGSKDQQNIAIKIDPDHHAHEARHDHLIPEIHVTLHSVEKQVACPQISEEWVQTPSDPAILVAPSDICQSNQEPQNAGIAGESSEPEDSALLERKLKLMLSETQALSAVEVKKRKEKELQNKRPWTQSDAFQGAIAVLILANAISMTVEADSENGEHAEVFKVTEHFFTAAFVLEYVLHIVFEGPRQYYSDTGNCVDFGLVVLCVLDVWIIQQVDVGKDLDLRSASILRMLRLFRLGRILRLFHIFRELRVILQGLMGGFRTLIWAGLFILVILYLFAMVATLNIGGASCDDPEIVPVRALKGSQGQPVDENAPYVGCTEFDSVGRAMLTLWLCVTDGCGDNIIKPMVLRSPWLMIFWVVFVFIASFGMLNIIVGLFCENVIQAASETEKKMSALQDEVRLAQLNELKRLFLAMDNDHSNTICRSEWINAHELPDVVETLESLGLGEELDLFDTLDVDRGGVLEFEEFFEGLLLVIKGNESAKARDMVPTFLTCELIRKKLTQVQSTIGQHHEDQSEDASRNDTSLHGQIAELRTELRSTVAALNAKLDANTAALGHQMDLLQTEISRNHHELLSALASASSTEQRNESQKMHLRHKHSLALTQRL